MADIADPNASPGAHDDATGNGNGADPRGIKRPRVSTAADDDDDDDDKPGRERRKIDIKFIQDKSRRHITFSKRKAGIMKKVCLTTSNRIAPCLGSRRCQLNANSFLFPGLRALGPHRHPSPAPRRLRDGASIYLHNSQATTSRHKARGQESYPGMQSDISTMLHTRPNASISRRVSMRQSPLREMKMASTPNQPSTLQKTSTTRRSQLHRQPCLEAAAGWQQATE